jgi:hypothetical protein
MDLLSGSGGVYGGTGSFLFQIGANTTQTMAVAIVSQTLSQYGLNSTTIATAASATSNIALSGYSNHHFEYAAIHHWCSGQSTQPCIG